MLSAFILGLLGSLHCFLMCGPLVASISLRHSKSNLQSALIYQLGRISVYGILGFIGGSVGWSLSLVALHQYLALIVGCILIFYALHQFFGLSKIFPHKTLIISYWIIRLKTKININSSFLMGGINGLLPCGLVYIALGGALMYETPLKGFLYMLIFGLGTCPVLIGCYLFPRLNFGTKMRFLNRLFPVVIFIMRLLILIRGLGLEIPYLSPGEKMLKLNTMEIKKSCH